MNIQLGQQLGRWACGMTVPELVNDALRRVLVVHAYNEALATP